jgi:hypothetical protein
MNRSTATSGTPRVGPKVNSWSYLRGKAGEPTFDGALRTIHDETSGARRITDRFVKACTAGEHGDPHPVAFALTIDLGSGERRERRED